MHRVLLLIDVQKGFDDPSWGRRNNQDAERRISSLLAHWRERGWPVVHVRHRSVEAHSPLRQEAPGYAFHDLARPVDGEAVFSKSVNSAFIGTGLEEHLRSKGYEQLLIVGLTTDHCISTTTRMAGNLGFDVQLVSDATATFDRRGPDGTLHSAETLHAVHLASLHGEFCQVMTTAQVLDTGREQ